MSAILFGSISTLVDTSELQRRAFNEAFSQHGLDWSWDHDTYVDLLTSNGGADRIAAYAKERGEDVDAAAVHATKSEIFRKLLADEAPEPRPGVVDTIQAAKDAGHRVGFVTTTSSDNVAAVLEVPGLDASDFDVVVDADVVSESKPDPAAYEYALAELDSGPGGAIAIEDNEGGVKSAAAAGIAVVAFPNANTAGHQFPEAAARVDELSLDDLLQTVGS